MSGAGGVGRGSGEEPALADHSRSARGDKAADLEQVPRAVVHAWKSRWLGGVEEAYDRVD